MTGIIYQLKEILILLHLDSIVVLFVHIYVR